LLGCAVTNLGRAASGLEVANATAAAEPETAYEAPELLIHIVNHENDTVTEDFDIVNQVIDIVNEVLDIVN
jgi:hypothetical protein